MGRKLSSGQQSSPVVSLTKKEGAFLQGALTNRKEVKTVWGVRPVYTLKVEETDMGLSVKQGTSYVDVPFVQGIEVAIFAPTILDRMLQQTEGGDRVRIVYSGLGKAKKGRNAPHMFDVEVL